MNQRIYILESGFFVLYNVFKSPPYCACIVANDFVVTAATVWINQKCLSIPIYVYRYLGYFLAWN